MSKKRNARRRTRNVLLIVSMMLVVAMASIGGTLAWLTAETSTITNTFTTSEIALTLTETLRADGTELDENEAWIGQLVPGVSLSKNPRVTVTADVDSYVFVKLTEANWPDWKKTQDGSEVRLVDYAVTDGWISLPGTPGVYYCRVSATDAANGFTKGILVDDKVTVDSSITKSQMDAQKNSPTLTIQAFAIQQANGNNSTFEPAEAWAQASAPQ